jgi:hypothetical protein
MLTVLEIKKSVVRFFGLAVRFSVRQASYWSWKALQ